MTVSFAELLDLAAEGFGGVAVSANDEFFASRGNLLKPGRGEFIAGKYTEYGKWMDGWETRRRRTPGFDWCIIKLGMAGVIRGVDVDTNHFIGNYPEYCSIEASSDEKSWVEILPKSLLQGGSRNLFPIVDEARFTHVRLNIYPDGGVARFRVHGEVRPDWKSLMQAQQPVDLAAAEHGGKVVACNDNFFGPKDNLIMPGRAIHMGDGWETRRKRRAGYDWIVVKLGAAGAINKIEVDTNHFKGNYPDMCSIDGAVLADDRLLPTDFFDRTDLGWEEILPRVKLEAHTRHFFEKELKAKKKYTHVRLNIYPDGGVSRLRIHGTPDVRA
ncbi:MAG: allantoicase [Deltaproteobacteria bacterium]|nr:allantoicase [Deltaproteobacteria bacterium]